ncbi:MAG TPA: 3-isopropylmalate dehydratase small subunit [Rhodopirellula baltica]|uniref:3-isopropylmalate dehydratase small subunit n=3 Tax=Rhodopirellula baltica TaxID=265606 RepID=LEUD_RHOBA|nr:3-isopropylmalate dehydratase small subunit [Rhodopirellula baltica]Q7UIA6.1 RecName: Full=3-isopropylmalate dehydratase small subunit; AltName: Full=Alpha-IPM isomerase; Short=IPMI; AltName: Full=Isopropylmalate isomerase [Rhodopirellula baltica SH 1]EKK04237.1 3-isopropylmalate dehydratase, small subunit [Rhodopirellula baltica SH28]ELP30411.1 3-isopropylmalate dehydratase, small subunit [Rhodopirellula baltica SWK14]CAD77708.1 3-isopropylmalate dehydratase small subunit [Rhodopirellula ba
MQNFTVHQGVVATLDRANVDTDQIIPKQFLKRIERTGFGQFLFFDWRFLEDGETENPDFELNRINVKGASILLTRQNFGSGSSREHAVWALDDYGFRAVIAPSFADIFFNNCFKNGVLPIALSEEDVEELFQRAEKGNPYQLTVDLENQVITDGQGFERSFEVDASRRHNMLHGLDDIAQTLLHEDKITAFEEARG